MTGTTWLGWWLRARPQARRALVAASLGWMLDAMDVLLYSLVLNDVRAEFHIGDAVSGLLIALPLASSAVGGALFGYLADVFGRTRALMGSIVAYSIFTAGCGLARTPFELAVWRTLVGLGLGGEWATGAALVAETWRDEDRGKALGLMQSAWAVGYALAAAVTALVLPRWGWRAVFFAGLLPALVTLWIRATLEEPPVWRDHRQRAPSPAAIWRACGVGLRRLAAIVTAMNAATMFAWWGLFTWIPSFLGRTAEQGGAGLSVVRTSTWIALMQVGMWLGYISFGFLSDAVGRKRLYVGYLIVAAAVVPIYGTARNPMTLLWLGPVVAFFGTGYFSGFGALTAEIFPTRIRATLQGVTYNAGRAVSALAPVVVGRLSTSFGLAAGLLVTSLAFLAAATLWLWIPETRGRSLE